MPSICEPPPECVFLAFSNENDKIRTTIRPKREPEFGPNLHLNSAGLWTKSRSQKWTNPQIRLWFLYMLVWRLWQPLLEMSHPLLEIVTPPCELGTTPCGEVTPSFGDMYMFMWGYAHPHLDIVHPCVENVHPHLAAGLGPAAAWCNLGATLFLILKKNWRAVSVHLDRGFRNPPWDFRKSH